MLWIDQKYVGLISYKLRNFKKKKQNYWNFSCPICGDSKTNHTRARGFIYLYQNRLVYKCFNCGYTSNVGSLIKHLDPLLYNEYVLENYKETSNLRNDHINLKETTLSILEPETTIKDAVLDDLLCVSDLPNDHIAKQYVINRKLPEDKWNKLYYTDKFKAWSNQFKHQFMNLDTDHPRLVIPFLNKHGKVFMYQGRAFGDEQPKYISVKLDESEAKVYGLDTVNYASRVYVVEGPVDSMFIPNSIAVGGADFDIPLVASIKSNVTLIPDNEPRNKEIVKMINKYITNGYSVCLWPDTVREKDINEMILAGRTVDQVMEIISSNTFSGITAQLKFGTWRKI